MKRAYGKALLAFLVYGVVQAAIGALLTLCLVLTGNAPSALLPSPLALSLILSGVVAVILVWRPMRLIRIRRAFSPSGLSPATACIGLVAGLLASLAINVAGELAGLEDKMADVVGALASNPLGALSICLAAPLCEELVFREGIQGGLSRAGARPAVAIVVASLLFGLLHFNPLPTFFATLMGVALGILYHATGNVLLSSALHIVNNTLAEVQMLLMGEGASQFSLCEALGGRASSLAVMSASLLASVLLFALFCRRARALL